MRPEGLAVERRSLGGEDGIGDFDLVDASGEGGVRGTDVPREGARGSGVVTEGMVGEAGAATRVAVLLVKKFAKRVVAGADNRGIIGFLDLRAFDGKGKSMTIKKELKEVDALADESKLIPENDLIEFINSVLVPVICRPAVDGSKKFEKKEKGRLSGIGGGGPDKEVGGFKNPTPWLELVIEERQEGFDGASIGLEVLWSGPEGNEVKRGDPRFIEEGLSMVPGLGPNKSAVNLVSVVIELLINLFRGDKGEVRKDAVFIFEEVNDFFLRRKVF